MQSPRNSTLANSEEDSQTREDDSLVIWWEQGYSSEANATIVRLVEAWEELSGIETNLQLKPPPIDKQLKTAIAQGNPPDIAFNSTISLIIPQLAGMGKLADVSDVIEPIRDSFNPNALAGATFLNRTIGHRGFYGIPTGMVTYNMHYWKPYLDRLGLAREDIPQDWQGFWQFWQAVRDRLHQMGETEINSFCLTLSGDSHDGKETLALFLHGNNVEVFAEDGTLVLDRPKNRQRLIETYRQLSSLYRDGFIPQEALEWTNPDDNFQFLDRQCLLVINGSLSIPSTQKQPDIPYNREEKNRYVNEIVTLSNWPNTADGNPFEIFIGTQAIVVPAEAIHVEEAKQFLAYFLQVENFKQWNEQLRGRFLPPLSELLNTPFWQDAGDPHFAAILDLQAQKTRPYPPAQNPAYADIAEEEILMGELERILREDISLEAAADAAIAGVREIVKRY
ncbi:MAG: extracellular solute-binding protein [Cyanobacteria bacterium P01_E01_bin.42]